MFKIDLSDTYDPIYVSENLDYFIFNSEVKEGQQNEIHITIERVEHALLNNVYNLAMGPIIEGVLRDDIKIKHTNSPKLFSTLIFLGITFLNENRDCYIGIDGSDDLRAYYYHRMFAANFENLKDTLDIIGVDWYVRLLRDKTRVETDEFGEPFFKPRPEIFDINRPYNDLYRYYMYKLK